MKTIILTSKDEYSTFSKEFKILDKVPNGYSPINWFSEDAKEKGYATFYNPSLRKEGYDLIAVDKKAYNQWLEEKEYNKPVNQIKVVISDLKAVYGLDIEASKIDKFYEIKINGKLIEKVVGPTNCMNSLKTIFNFLKAQRGA